MPQTELKLTDLPPDLPPDKEPKQPDSFFDALKQSFSPDLTRFMQQNAPGFAVNPKAGATLLGLETAGNLISVPARIIAAWAGSTETPTINPTDLKFGITTPEQRRKQKETTKPIGSFNDLLAKKTEAGELALGEDGNIVGRTAISGTFDPTNFVSGAGLIKALKLNPAKVAPKILDDAADIISKTPKQQQKIADNLAQEAAQEASFKESVHSPLSRLFQDSEKLDPNKVGRSKLLNNKFIANAVKDHQDEVLKGRGGKMNMQNLVDAYQADPTLANKMAKEMMESAPAEQGAAVFQHAINNLPRILDDIVGGKLPQELTDILAMKAKAGRFLRSQKELNENFLLQVRESIDGLDIPDVAKMKIKDWFVDSGFDQGGVIKPTFWSKVVEWATMVKLTGLSTAVKAVVGNSSMVLLRPVEKFSAGATDAFLYGTKRLLGRDAQRNVHMREALAQVKGAFVGMRNGGKEFLKVMKSEKAAFEAQSKFGEVFQHGGAIQGKLGRIVRSPGRVMGAIDVFFKNMHLQAELTAGAIKRGLDDGLKGADLDSFIANALDNPESVLGDVVYNKAISQSKINVFQEPLRGFAEKVNVLRKDYPALRLLIPFWNTPVNLYKQSLKRTPIAFMLPKTWRTVRTNKQAVHLLRKRNMKATPENIAAIKSEFDNAARLDALSTAAIGSSVLGGMVYLGLEGGLTGGGPESTSQLNTLRLTGWQPYSFKAGDVYYSYRGFEPVSGWMRAAADIAENKKHGESFAGSLAKNLGLSFLSQFTENPFLMGVTDLTNAIEQANRGDVPTVFANLVVGATVPVILQQWGTRYYDPVIRAPRTFPEKIKSRLPFGVSKSVPAARDIFGEVVRRDDPVLQNLGFTRRFDKKSRVGNELVRLKIGLNPPSRFVDGNELSKEEYERLSTLTGTMIKQGLERLLRAPGYSQMDDVLKVKVLRKTINKMRNIGKSQALQKYYR